MQRILLFKESCQLSEECLEKSFDNSNDFEKEKIINKLLLSRVLKRVVLNVDIDDLNTYEEENHDSVVKYKFSFVGILTIGSYCLVVYPKYIQNIDNDFYNNQLKLRQIINVIDKSRLMNESISGQEEYSSNILPLMIKILKDYQSQGLYHTDQAIIEYNGEGSINWDLTVNECQTYLVNKKPYYFDFYTDNQKLDEFNIIRKLHACIITDIAKQLEPILSLFDINYVELTNDTIFDFGDIDHINYLLNSELSLQFITKKRLILCDLLNYINNSQYSDEELGIDLYGTNSFNLVWEQVCRVIYQDDLSKKLNSLKLRLSDAENNIDYRSLLTLRDIVDKPVWNYQGEKITASKTLELDVLRVNHHDKKFEIYDGKYYAVKVNKNSISGQPGVSDITKQYLYQLAFAKLAQINQFSFSNAFVIPVDELNRDYGDGVDYGFVKLAMFNELNLNDIQIIARDAQTAFDIFLKMT